MGSNANQAAADWRSQSLASLTDHIVQTHHAFCRQEVMRLALLFREVIGKYGKDHPELNRIHDLFLQMSRDLSMHLLKEEQTLFPYMIKVEAAVAKGDPVSWPPFGTVGNPIRMMILEHGKATGEIEEIRKLSGNYTPPAGADDSYSTLYEALFAFDRDMQTHVQKEDGLLFPRAIAMEEEACGRQSVAGE